jgi:hypothetical protein
LTPEIGMLRRQSWRPHQRKQHSRSRYARERMLRRGHVTAKIPEPMRPISGGSPLGAAGQPQVAASRMGVGPLHSIDEVAEGDEVMEKRGRQEGITTEQAKDSAGNPCCRTSGV